MQELFFSVVDQEGRRINGALIRFYVHDKLVMEGTQRENPLRFATNAPIQNVDVEVFFGRTHEWVKVAMTDHNYELRINTTQNGQDGKKPGWIAIVTTLITALSAIIVGYWQFVYKPAHSRDYGQAKQVQLRIKVTDAGSAALLPNTHVVIEDGSRQQEDTTDGNGSTRQFSFPQQGPPNLRITVDAGQYESTVRNLDRPTADQTYTIALKRRTGTTTGPRTTGSPQVNGTWTIEAPADPANARISNGTFTFVPQPDKSAVVTAHFVADQMNVQLTGKAGTTGHQVHIEFKAINSVGGSWEGTGDFIFDSPTRMTGRIQSKRGDDIGFVLSKS
jgi:hypothetical protein